MPVRNLFIIALTAIVSLTCYSTASRNRYANLFAEALDTIETQALQVVPRSELFTYAMDGMTSRLDGHSKYISGEMFQVFNEDLKQEFGGVGMYVENHPTSGKLTVLAPIPGAPAYDSGIRSGDTIVEIDGETTEDVDRGAAIEMIRGPRGEIVQILIDRDGTEQLHELERDFIHEPSLHGDFRNADGSWNFYLKDYPRIGYFRLIQFGNKSAEEFRAALQEIEGKVDGLIFDLRNNAGGLLDGAIEICDLLLPRRKLIVSTHGRNNVLEEEHFSQMSPLFDVKTPIVVLINRDSASASEIVSACLQDHDRAVLIGETSWGKGTVQHVIPIQKGKSALKLTTSSYRRPNGENIDRYDKKAIESGHWGVKPDDGFEIELTDEAVFQNRRRRSFMDLRGLLPPEEQAERDQDNASEIVDEPLEKAIDWLEKYDANRVAA